MHASNGSQAGLWTTKKQSCCSFCRWLCETNGLAEISQISNQSGLLASYPWAWLMFLGMSIRLSAWGFGVAHGSYSGDEAGDLTGISFEESGSNLMDSLALGIAGPSGKLALLDSLTRWNHWWLPLGPLSLPWLLVSVASLGFSWCTYEYVYMKAAN